MIITVLARGAHHLCQAQRHLWPKIMAAHLTLHVPGLLQRLWGCSDHAAAVSWLIMFPALIIQR